MGVDVNGWPTNVATNELIESAWGNGVVKSVLYALVAAGVNSVAEHIQSAIGNVLHTPLAASAYATRMIVNATVWAGSDSTGLGGIQAGVLTNVSGGNSPLTPVTSTATANVYGVCPLVWSWVVPANADPSYAITAAWTTGGGTIYTAGRTTWQRFRA